MDITGQMIHPLRDLIADGDFPLADFVDAAAGSLLDRLHYTDAQSYDEDGQFVIDLTLAFEGELALKPPGTDVIALVLASGGVGWTGVKARFVIGPELSVSLIELTFGLRFDGSVLRNVETSAPAELSVSADVILGPNGITLSNTTGASLAPAYLLSTKAIVEAEDVSFAFGNDKRPEYVDDDFTGLTFDKLKVTLPSDMFELDAGSELDIAIEKAALGTTGFTGNVELASTDLEQPVSGKLLGFPFRFRSFSFNAHENALLDFSLGADVRVEALEDGAEEKWLGFDFTFSNTGAVQAILSVAQPSEPSEDPAVLASFEFDDVLRLDARSAQISGEDDIWAIYLSGSLKLLFDGTSDWPAIEFERLGVTSNGNLLLPDGGGIAFDEPLSVNFHYVQLSLTKFQFGHPDNAPERLRLALNGEVNLIKSLPAGASVEGLTIEWTPGQPGRDIKFEGIGFELAVPGSFRGALSVAYVSSGDVVEFRGSGKLEIASLDVSVDVGVVVGHQNAAPGVEAFTYFYLFADAKLMPTGIPIGNTSMSIYGFQGLVAVNMELAVDAALPADERYYQLFIREPIGMTDVTKWRRCRGQMAFGMGIIIGTADKGFALNAKGMLIIALPDLTILLQARANFLKKKPDMSTAEEGTLDALMLYASGDDILLLDITAHWGVPNIISVDGHARAYFSFSDPHAWYLEIGRDEEGKRVVAKALSWNDNWLFTAGFWFRLDKHGVVTGAQVDLDLRKERGGFWVSVGGSARGEMKLFWEPSQWEGMLAMSGRIKAGYRRWSVGITLSGDVRARVEQPYDVHLHVEACIDLWLDSICKGFDFDWQKLTPPELEPPFRRWAATPRHFTPYELTGPDGVVILEEGVMTLEPGTTAVPVIQPHSVISLDFAKPMIDATAAFNEAVALDDGGFVAIGEGSGWSVAHRIDAITLIRDPDTAATPVPLWGTWARETLEPNTTLRLLSSDRYGDDGSLTGGFVDGAGLDYCDPPKTTRVCVSLEQISPGYGSLERSLLYNWLHPGDGENWATPDRLVIVFPSPVSNVTVDERPITTGDGGMSVTIIAKSWGRTPPRKLCYDLGYGRPDWASQSVRGGLLTGLEAWTVDGELLTMMGRTIYELRVDTTAELKAPDGNVTTPLGAPATLRARFQTDGPPARQSALQNYIFRVHPSDGARPAYYGYDLLVEFFEDYVPKLYTKVGEQLGIRLFDAQGRPCVGPDGETVLLPLAQPAPVPWHNAAAAWQQILEANVASGCANGPLPPEYANSGLGLPAAKSGLAPNSHHRAAVVSSARPDVPLASWAFTTSRFATFSDLVTRGRKVERALAIAAPAASPGSFEDAARQFNVPTIRYVEQLTVTPLVDAASATCAAILFEAPEPLDMGGRCGVTVAGQAVSYLANVDGTRVFVVPQTGAFPLGVVAITMSFLRDVGASDVKLAVSGNSAPETVAFNVEVVAP